MEYVISVLVGYLLGSISPAALIAKIKKTNLRKAGTGNLGATNTTLVFGKKFGIIVMAFDIFKSALAVIIAKLIFSEVSALAGLLAGASAVVGHMFPFYMKFRGGKGLASYGGMILAFDPLLFLILLCLSLAAMFIFNYGVAMTVSAAVCFPFLVAFRYRENGLVIALAIVAAFVSALLIARHIGNIHRAFTSRELTVRQFLKRVFGKAKPAENEDQEEKVESANK